MNRWLSYLAAVVIFAVCGVGFASAQNEPRPGTVIVPPTNSERPEDVGVRAHTNFLIFVPAARKENGKPQLTGTAPSGETPQSLSCVYQTWAGNIQGCPINGSYANPSGGSNVIAIVDAYDYPTAQQDFDTFSNQFHLPLSGAPCADGQPCFSQVYATANGLPPKSNCGWAQEAALDIEWAHAMAPDAQIILVEAASSRNNDLLDAVNMATSLVASKGGGEVSMSWGSSEFSGESNYDSYFTHSKVTYVASSGDTGGKVIWPSASANVVSAGGTTVNRSGGLLTGETTWSSAGGGPSSYIPVPGYQSGIYNLSQLLNGSRGTPDISFDANPSSGVSVYDSTFCQGLSGWLVFGGTSVSAPSLSGIFNFSGDFSGNNSIQTNLYGNYSSVSNSGNGSYSADFYDVTSGSAGSYSATPDWDFASGIGTLRGTGGLATSSTTSSPSFSLSASPSSVSLTQGQSTSVDVTVTPSNGYTGTVNLSLSCPSGVSCSLSANSVDTSSTSSVTLTISTTTSTTASSYTLTVTGTDSKSTSLTSSATVSLDVTSASSGGDFSISASPGNVTLHGGGTATYSVTITPSGGFDQQVDFSMTSSSGGLSATFSPASVTGSGTTTMSVTPSSSKASYTLTITGSVSGGPSHSTTVGLKVR